MSRRSRCETCKEKCGKLKIDVETLRKLQILYRKLLKCWPDSPLIPYLPYKIFDEIKFRSTMYNKSLYDVIQAGLEYHDQVGIYACDPDAYNAFDLMFNNFLNIEYGFNRAEGHPERDFGEEPRGIGELDPVYVMSTRIRISRALKGIPFNPALKKDAYPKIEMKIEGALSRLTGDLAGTYVKLNEIDEADMKKLRKEHILPQPMDDVQKFGKMNEFYPEGRGYFVNDSRTFVVWANEKDHVRIISMQKDGNLREVYERAIDALEQFDDLLSFSRHEQLGYLSTNPASLGTGLKCSVHMKLPKLGRVKEALAKAAEVNNLTLKGIDCDYMKVKSGRFDLSSRQTIGLTEYEIVRAFYSSVRGMIAAEKAFVAPRKCEDKCGKGKAHPDVVQTLTCKYESFLCSDSKSLLKKYLTPEVFDNLKWKKTQYKMTLLDCVQTGLENPDSSCGLYAACPESYDLFGDLFDPVIEDYHGFPKSASHPPQDWGESGQLDNVDPEGKYVISTRVRTARSIKCYPFNPGMSEAQYKEIEAKVSCALCSLTGDLRGIYTPLTEMTDEEIDQLIDDHILFKGGDRFLESANAYRFWPKHRGVFLNRNRTFIVWVNEEDHMRIISLEQGADVAKVYERLATAVKELDKKLEFTRHDRYGYLSMCPTNIGTGIRASVHIKLPKLSNDEAKLKEIANRLNLQIRGSGGEHTESKEGIMDISNRRRLGVAEKDIIKEMFTGIKELIEQEEKS
ncbi:unnamed protein product [Phyllotreta striolata]|uniref:arginine kinase n=1 Tax=Phyllotreta striolata TaxID=444603 RepID=A0A9N9XJ62_PHYSR|nr:unnamed protein product [Phyllotreta striolata]